MRPLNRLTQAATLIMFNLKEQLTYLVEASEFGSYDIFSSYDCLPVEEESRHFFVNEICCPPQGWKNSPAIFENRILMGVRQPQVLLGSEETGVIQWIDDILIYECSVEHLLTSMEKLLQQLHLKKLRLKLDKCLLLGRQAEWCGREFSAQGYQGS